MALAESALFKAIKDLLKFDADKPIDVICLIAVLAASIFAVATGLLPFGFLLVCGFIIAYLILKNLLRLICLLAGKAHFEFTFGWVINRRYRRLNDKEKFILHNFVEADDPVMHFNISKMPLVNFERLVEKKFLDSFEPIIPNDDVGQLQVALGDRFIEAKMNRKIFDYLTVDHCKNALNLGFTLYRADVRQRQRQDT